MSEIHTNYIQSNDARASWGQFEKNASAMTAAHQLMSFGMRSSDDSEWPEYCGKTKPSVFPHRLNSIGHLSRRCFSTDVKAER